MNRPFKQLPLSSSHTSPNWRARSTACRRNNCHYHFVCSIIVLILSSEALGAFPLLANQSDLGIIGLLQSIKCISIYLKLKNLKSKTF